MQRQDDGRLYHTPKTVYWSGFNKRMSVTGQNDHGDCVNTWVLEFQINMEIIAYNDLDQNKYPQR